MVIRAHKKAALYLNVGTLQHVYFTYLECTCTFIEYLNVGTLQLVW